MPYVAKDRATCLSTRDDARAGRGGPTRVPRTAHHTRTRPKGPPRGGTGTPETPFRHLKATARDSNREARDGPPPVVAPPSGRPKSPRQQEGPSESPIRARHTYWAAMGGGLKRPKSREPPPAAPRDRCVHTRSSDPEPDMDNGRATVRNVRSKCRCSCVLQFTFRHAASCVLHRPPSQVIHCTVGYSGYDRPPLARRAGRFKLSEVTPESSRDR